MGDRPAPERRRAADGTWEVRVRDQWMPSEDPATMAAWVAWQDGITRAAHLLGGKPKEEDAPEPERRKGPRGTPQVRIDGKWIAESMVQAWDAWERHRSPAAAAEELGISRDLLKGRLKRYEDVFGVERQPAIEQAPPDEHPQSARFDSGHKRKPWDQPHQGPTADGDHDVGTERQASEHEHQWGAWADLAHMVEACVVEGCEETRPWEPPAALSDAGADHASSMHPEPLGWRHDAQADALLVISFDATIPVADLVNWEDERRNQLLTAIELLQDALGRVGS